MLKMTLTLVMNMIEDLFLELGDDEESDGEKNKRRQYQSPNLVELYGDLDHFDDSFYPDNANPGRLEISMIHPDIYT